MLEEVSVLVKVLVCPFDVLPCERSGDCGDYCLECRTFHNACSRFDAVKFANDASIRAGFGLAR